MTNKRPRDTPLFSPSPFPFLFLSSSLTSLPILSISSLSRTLVISVVAARPFVACTLPTHGLSHLDHQLHSAYCLRHRATELKVGPAVAV